MNVVRLVSDNAYTSGTWLLLHLLKFRLPSTLTWACHSKRLRFLLSCEGGLAQCEKSKISIEILEKLSGILILFGQDFLRRKWGSPTEIASRVKWGLIKQFEVRIMTLTQKWRNLNLTRNSFYILFPAKDIMNYRRIILAACTFVSKELVHSLADEFWTPMNKLINLNVVYLKLPKKHRGPQKTPSRATCAQRVWESWRKGFICRSWQLSLRYTISSLFSEACTPIF